MTHQPPGDPHAPQPVDRYVSWATLLAKWTAFARASVALPETDEGRAWRESVPPVITLQAVAYALGELERLEPDERSLAVDRARVLVEQAEGTLAGIWGTAGLPGQVRELVGDARAALTHASEQVQHRPGSAPS